MNRFSDHRNNVRIPGAIERFGREQKDRRKFQSVGHLPFAPVASGSSKQRERPRKGFNLRTAGGAFACVPQSGRVAGAYQACANLLWRQVLPHFICSLSAARTDFSARNRCVLTVPSFIPVTAPISSRSRSSTNRSRNTVRCFPDSRPATFQILSTCCLAAAICSGDTCRSEIQSLASDKSTSARSVRLQNFRRPLAS